MAPLLRSTLNRPMAIFGVALVLRLAALLALGTAAEAEGKTAWEWGWEAAALADSWLTTDVYGDPFGSSTGPSGWLTPPFPLLIAGLMTLFGGVTPAAATALFVLQCLASAATCAALVPLGRSLGSARAGRLAAWLLVFHPLAIWLAVGRVWDTTLVAAALTAFLLLLVRTGPRPRPSRAAMLGFTYGALLLLNPAPLSLAPAIALYLWGPGVRITLPRLLAFATGALVVISPWIARNRLELGSAALRTNLGVELRVGNHDGAAGRNNTALHPADPVNTGRYVELGEVAFARESGRAAVDWIREDAARFGALCLRRAQLFWVGESPNQDPRLSRGQGGADDPATWLKWLATFSVGILALLGALLRRPRTRESWLVVGAMVLFPLPYYLTHVSERYRFPIEPLLLLALCWLLVRRQEVRQENPVA